MKTLSLFSAALLSLPLYAASPGYRAMTPAELSAQGLVAGEAEYLTPLAALAAPMGTAESPAQIAASHFLSLGGSAFRPVSWKVKLASIGNPMSVYCNPSSTGSIAEAQVLLPQGAKLQVLRLWAKQQAGEELNVALLRRCQPSFAAGTPSVTNLVTLDSAGQSSNFSLASTIANDVVVDNEMCTYYVRARFGPTTTACTGAINLQKIRIQWAD